MISAQEAVDLATNSVDTEFYLLLSETAETIKKTAKQGRFNCYVPCNNMLVLDKLIKYLISKKYCVSRSMCGVSISW